MTVFSQRAALLAGAAILAAGPASADFDLTILHINDLHSRIEPINAYDSTCSAEDDAAGECFGGVARLMTAIDARRGAAAAEGRSVLVLDAGDQFQGSLFYSTYKGEAAAEFMNRIGFDAMAVGNHEFDDGPGVLAAFAEALGTPLTSANLDIPAGSALAGQVEPHLILDVDGERVGVVSAVAEDTAELSSPGEVGIGESIEAIRAQVEALEAEGVNKIIALTHVGLPRDLEIAAAIPQIDIIVGGHSHTLLSNTADGAAGPYPTMVDAGNKQTPVVQAYAYGKYLGELHVTFDDDGNVVSAEGEPVLVDASFAADPEIADRVAALAEPIETLKTQVVGETAAEIDGSRETCRVMECEMGVLVADALLDRVADQGAQIAIQNGGGLRASIDAGPVTMGEVLTVLPFQNTLATFELTGANVVAALENGVSQVEEGAGRFPQVAGLRYSWDGSKPAGERIVSVEVGTEGDFAPIDPEAVYLVVSNNFMRAGGDGYAMFETEGMNAYDYGPGVEQVVADYIAANSPYEPRVEGRITRVDN